MTAKHQIKVLDSDKQRTDIVCIADVAKESVLTTRTARETLGASKSSKISYFLYNIFTVLDGIPSENCYVFYLVCKII